jgi:hypothetical protein
LIRQIVVARHSVSSAMNKSRFMWVPTYVGMTGGESGAINPACRLTTPALTTLGLIPAL